MAKHWSYKPKSPGSIPGGATSKDKTREYSRVFLFHHLVFFSIIVYMKNNNLESWRRKVLVTAATDAIWEQNVLDFAGMRNTLDKLLAKDYKNAPLLENIIQAICSVKYNGNGSEVKLRKAATKLIAQEILREKVIISRSAISSLQRL